MNRHLMLLLLPLLACGSPQVQTGPAVDDNGIPLDWPERPRVDGPVTANWPQSQTQHVGKENAGVTVQVVPRHDSPAVFLRWVLPGGRSLETAGKVRWPEGTVQLATELAPMGTRAYPGTALAAKLASLGAQLDMNALADGVVLDVHVLSHRLPQVLELMKEVLTAPQLENALLESLKARHHGDLQNDAQSPQIVAENLAKRLIFGPQHPYGSSGLTLESLGKINRKQVQEAAAQAFRLGGSQLIAVGDTDAETLGKALTQVFGQTLDLPPIAVALPEPASEATAPGCHLVAIPGATQNALVVATRGIRRADRLWPELQVTNQILGGSASARLFTELREKRGLGYGASSRLEGRRLGGAWLLNASVRTEVTVEALTVVQNQLNLLQKTPPNAEELASAQRYLAGQFALALADGDDLADLLAMGPLYGMQTAELAHYLENVQRVEAGRVAELAENWQVLGDNVVVLAGDPAQLRPAIDAQCMATHGRVQEHDAQGKLLKVYVGSDREMSDAARSSAFALWTKSPAGLQALTRYVTDATHAPKFRAQALTMLGASPASGQVVEIGRQAADWTEIAAELVRMMLARLGARSPAENMEIRQTVLALADTATRTDGGQRDLTPEVAAAARKVLANWALSGMDSDLPKDELQIRATRLADGDLARLGSGLAPDVLGRWIAADVRRHEAATALLAQKSPEADAALLNGYRQYLAGGVAPDAEDLQMLSQIGSAEGILLLLHAHANLEHRDAVPAQLATMQTIRREMARLKPEQLTENFERFDPFLESLLTMRNADDRWWAADLLIRNMGTDGLRRVLAEIASDDHYRDPKWHTIDPKVQVAKLAQEAILPLTATKVQPMVLATLVRRNAMGKVIAVTALKALADEASIAALKTVSDETDVSQLLDLQTPLTVHEMALAAVDVAKYIAEVDAQERAGKLDAASAQKYRVAAFGIVDLFDKRLRAEVHRLVTGGPAPAPEEPAPESSAAPAPSTP